MKNMLLLGDVARLLGVEPYRIVYLLSSGQLPEPPRFGGRRVFFNEDVERVAKKLGMELGGEQMREARNAAPYAIRQEQLTIEALKRLNLLPDINMSNKTET